MEGRGLNVLHTDMYTDTRTDPPTKLSTGVFVLLQTKDDQRP